MQSDEIVIHTDGGSRGNPGPAACAFVVEQNGEVVYQDSKFLGITTNNVAEYNGVVIALGWLEKYLITSHLSPVTFYLDSELVVKQINGLYKVKDENLRQLISEVFKILKELSVRINFHHVKREKNKQADYLVNVKLDKSV